MKIEQLEDGRWLFDAGEIRGSRVRRKFATRALAEAFMKKGKQLIKDEGERLAGEWLSMAADEIDKIIAYRRQIISLNGKPDWNRGRELHIAHLTAMKMGGLLCPLLTEYIDRKRKAGRDAGYMDRLERELGSFAAHYPKLTAADITDRHIDSFLDGLGLEQLTRANRIRDLKGLFSYAKKRGLCPRNPADLTEPIKIVRKRNKAFAVQEIAVILWVSDQHPEWELTPYISFNLWGSSRVSESFRLDWTEYIPEEGSLVFEAAATKVNHERVTEHLPPVLLDWVKPYVKLEGPLSPSESTVEWRRAHYLVPAVQRILPQFKWLRNGLRKTSISAEFALTKDAKTTAARHGTSPEMLFDNYRAIVRETEAPKYYSMTRHNITQYLRGIVPEAELADWEDKFPQTASNSGIISKTFDGCKIISSETLQSRQSASQV